MSDEEANFKVKKNERGLEQVFAHLTEGSEGEDAHGQSAGETVSRDLTLCYAEYASPNVTIGE